MIPTAACSSLPRSRALHLRLPVPSHTATIAPVVSVLWSSTTVSRGLHRPVEDAPSVSPQSWGTCSASILKRHLARDLASVFAQKTRKVVEDTSEKLGVVNHLKHAADGCGWLCLWLDCDREGENICYEVLKVLSPFTAAPDRVWRARFSAVTETEVKSALARLSKPNRAEAHAVDVRQQLDLKVGVAFTRLLTRTLRDAARQRFALPALRLLQVL